MEDLWIGDRVKILSTGEIAYYEGIENNKVKLRLTDGHYMSVNSIDFIPIGDEVIEQKLAFAEDVKKTDSKKNSQIAENTIDLHYDNLTQYFTHDSGTILDFQINSCEEFLKRIIGENKGFVRIIHGKGEGILKKAIENLLNKYKYAVSLLSAHPDAGSIDIWLK